MSVPQGRLDRYLSSPGCSQAPELTTVMWQMALLLEGMAGLPLSPGVTRITSLVTLGVAESMQKAAVCSSCP